MMQGEAKMRKTLFNAAILGMVVLMAVSAVRVAEAVTQEEAKALALKAVAYWQANGPSRMSVKGCPSGFV